MVLGEEPSISLTLSSLCTPITSSSNLLQATLMPSNNKVTTRPTQQYYSKLLQYQLYMEGKL